MIDINNDWLPLGSVVRLKEGERLLMIAGFMAIEKNTGVAYDYAGYPYPEGKQTDQELFFDRSLIEEVYQLGYLDANGLLFWQNLDNSEKSYQEERLRRSKDGPSGDEGGAG